jgi:hypothetical protein
VFRLDRGRDEIQFYGALVDAGGVAGEARESLE